MSTNTYLTKIKEKIENAADRYKTKILKQNKQAQIDIFKKKAIISEQVQNDKKFLFN